MSTYIRHKMTETETVCSDETKLSETETVCSDNSIIGSIFGYLKQWKCAQWKKLQK